MEKVFLEFKDGDVTTEVSLDNPKIVIDPIPDAYGEFIGVKTSCGNCKEEHLYLFKLTREGIHDDGPRKIYSFTGVV